jgi:hypothetical protein
VSQLPTVASVGSTAVERQLPVVAPPQMVSTVEPLRDKTVELAEKGVKARALDQLPRLYSRCRMRCRAARVAELGGRPVGGRRIARRVVGGPRHRGEQIASRPPGWSRRRRREPRGGARRLSGRPRWQIGPEHRSTHMMITG